MPSASTPSCTRSPPNQPNPYACVWWSSSLSMDLQCHCPLTMVHHSHQMSLQNSHAPLHSYTIHPSTHFPWSNGFIERQVRTIKTALNTVLPANKPLASVLLDLRSTPIGPNMPAPCEILHNRTIQ